MIPKPAAAFLLWGAAVTLALLIQQDLGASSVDPLSRFLGSAKEAVGDTLFLKADVYFHGGVRHEDHHDETAEALEKEGVIHEDAAPAEAAPKDWIEKMNRRIQVHEIVHLSKENRKEMLPFFAMAAALDPRNVEAVLTAAYWLDSEFGKSADALEVLKKGLRDNPGSWEIENALGRFYFRTREWAPAEQHLRQAAERSGPAPLENYTRVDLYYHLAEACAALGKKAEALQAYRVAERFFDGKTTLFLRSAILDKIRQ